MISRRHLLTTAAAGPFLIALAGTLARAAAPARVLVLLELSGGNDGLNTVVPLRDPAYARARPTLAIPRDRLLPLDERLGLHPALAPLIPLWHGRELAIALGVGYAPPNRSHFRSIEIWDSGSGTDDAPREGWLHRVIAEAGAPRGFTAQGIVLGGGEGPLAGTAFAPVVLGDPRQLGEAAGLPAAAADATANPALAHILATRARLRSVALEIERRLAAAPELQTAFPRTALGSQLRRAAALIAAGVPASVLKLRHSGYDTHAQQPARHAALLAELAEGLAAFRAALVEAGAWRRTLVATYSEFGRRVAENASGGTDHGAAAPHFLLGGTLRGGFLGVQPPLTDLGNGDLRPTLDFRRLYAALAQDWLGLPPAPGALGRHEPLALLG